MRNAVWRHGKHPMGANRLDEQHDQPHRHERQTSAGVHHEREHQSDPGTLEKGRGPRPSGTQDRQAVWQPEDIIQTLNLSVTND